MELEKKARYAMNLRWYSVVNYLIALAEQIALWHYGHITFFWWALGLNILGVFSLSMNISKLEKQFIN